MKVILFSIFEFLKDPFMYSYNLYKLRMNSKVFILMEILNTLLLPTFQVCIQWKIVSRQNCSTSLMFRIGFDNERRC